MSYQDNQQFYVDNGVLEDGVFEIGDSGGEIVHWIQDEWREDPELVISAMLNALQVVYTNGPDALRRLVKRPYPAKEVA